MPLRNRKGESRKEIYTSEPETKFPTGAKSDILCVKIKLPTDAYFRFCFQSCVYFKNVPKSKKCVIIVATENAKLELLKVLFSYAIVLSFFTKKPLETWGLWIFSIKCDVILRSRRISFNMPQGFMRMPL